MSLTRLIYVSTITSEFSLGDIDKILESSYRRNSANNISGALYFSTRYFMQYLEGDRADLEETYARIIQDRRHANCIVYELEPIEKREFEDWSLAYIPQSESLRSLNSRFMQSAQFNPYDIPQQNVFAFILELKAYLPRVYLEGLTC